MFVYIIFGRVWQMLAGNGRNEENCGRFGDNLFYIIFEKSKKGIAFFQMVVYNRFVVNCGVTEQCFPINFQSQNTV